MGSKECRKIYSAKVSHVLKQLPVENVFSNFLAADRAGRSMHVVLFLKRLKICQ